MTARWAAPPRLGAFARGTALLVATVATLLLLVVVLVPQALGATSLSVLSGSMEPDIAVGDVVVVKPAAADDLAVGDVVTYAKSSRPGAALVTHRVVDLQRADGRLVLTTQGDANPVPDAEPVPYEAVRGRVLYEIPWVGHLRERAPAEGLLLILAILGLAGWAGVRLPRGSMSEVPVAAEVPEVPVSRTEPVAVPAAVAADPADVLLAVLPAGIDARPVHEVLQAWRREAPGPTPEPVLQPLRSGELAVAVAGPSDDLDGLARALADLQPPATGVAAAPRTAHAGRSAREVILRDEGVLVER